MEYIAELVIRTHAPLDSETLSDVAELGGAAGGNSGEHVLDTSLTVRARTVSEAAAKAVQAVTKIAPGEVISIEVMTPEEQDRRLDLPTFPPLAGSAEASEILGVSKQRLAVLRMRDDFPAPVATLASGPVWRAGDLSTFALGWQRKPGRKPKAERESRASA